MNWSVLPWDRTAHGSFTFAEVRRCATKFPYATPGANQESVGRWLVDKVRQCSVANPSGCWAAVDVEDHDVVLGVLLSPGPQRITWAYTKYAVRRRGIASALAKLVGIDFSEPTYLGVWTMAASRIAASGYRLVPEIQEEDQ